jgi:hypothetical protein
MSGQFTPGPWLFGLSNRNNEAAIIGDIDSVVCYLPDATTGCTFKPADARLIAAAPMLLAVVQELEESASYWSEYDVPLGIVDRLRAAIAAATGPRFDRSPRRRCRAGRGGTGISR